MSFEFPVNLDDYTDEEKKNAIRDQRKMRKYKDKSFLEQARINARNKGYSITAAVTVFIMICVWQKENINRILNPPTETINRQIIAHNLPQTCELNSRKINAFTKKLDELNEKLDDLLANYLKKKSYSRRN